MVAWGQGAQGAAGGAMAGAAFGPVGALIGGGIGGLAGLFGGDPQGDQQARLMQEYQRWQQMQAPQAGPAQLAQQSGYEADRAGLIAQLQALSTGQGPSLAQQQMREAMDRSVGAQGAMAAGAAGRGVSAGAAYRNAANTTAAVQSQGARDTAFARSNEQLGAMNQLGNVIGQGVSAQNANSQFNAGQQNAMAQSNLSAKLQAMGYSASAINSILQQMGGNAGPGLGTQIMAGGAQAGSYFAGMHGAQNAQGQTQGTYGGGGNYDYFGGNGTTGASAVNAGAQPGTPPQGWY